MGFIVLTFKQEVQPLALLEKNAKNYRHRHGVIQNTQFCLEASGSQPYKEAAHDGRPRGTGRNAGHSRVRLVPQKCAGDSHNCGGAVGRPAWLVDSAKQSVQSGMLKSPRNAIAIAFLLQTIMLLSFPGEILMHMLKMMIIPLICTLI